MSVNAAWNVWNFRRNLVAELLADGHRVSVLAPPDSSTSHLESIGCRIVPLAMEVKSVSPLADFRLMQRLRRHFRDERPDVILSYTIKNNIFGAIAAHPLRIPFIPTVTGLGTAFVSGGLLQAIVEPLYRRAFAQLPVVFFQNTDDRDLFVRSRLVEARQARLLPGSGIDLEWFAASEFTPDTDGPVFLLISRLLRDKGVFEYVEAARIVKLKIPQARFQILGSIDSANRTAISEALVHSWQDEGIIEYLGETTDVRPFIAAAHCVVLPSYREGAPRTLIEASAMARPLIATDVPGCRSVVEHGRTGLLCKPRSAEDLAADCLRFVDIPYESKVDMGRAGRIKMEREFDQAIVIAAYRGALTTCR